MTGTEIFTSGDRPDLAEQAQATFIAGWPEFVFHDSVAAEYSGRVAAYFPRYDLLLVEDGEVLAGGWGVPLRWDGAPATVPDGYDGALVEAVDGHEAGVVPDTLSVMAAAVRPDRAGTGLAGRLLTALRERAVEAGLSRVIAPVRPTLKPRYPLTAMADFAGWARPDGLHLDPWIRTHQRLGATVLGPAVRSMVITGTVAEWEDWTKMAFPQSGRYVVPDALDLVEIDCEQDRGIYTETNLWMRHL
jgi:GNAT superfamily N-acetyltransferase